jgi:hypothetical protein
MAYGTASLILETDDVHAHQPDGGGDTITIGGKVFEGLVAGLGEVAGNAVDQLQGVVARDVVSGEGIGPGGGDQVIGRGRGGLTTSAPVVQFKVSFSDSTSSTMSSTVRQKAYKGADSGAFFFRAEDRTQNGRICYARR